MDTSRLNETGRRETDLDALLHGVDGRHHRHDFLFRGNHLRDRQLADVLQRLEFDLIDGFEALLEVGLHAHDVLAF